MRMHVEAITGAPLPHGILGACTDIRDVKDTHELLGIEWLALGCCPVNVWRDPCLEDESPGDESPGARPRKQFCRPATEHADPITVYAGAECSTIGWTYAEARGHAGAPLALGEQEAVEAGFWTSKLAMTAVDLTPAAVRLGQAALQGVAGRAAGRCACAPAARRSSGRRPGWT
ncbi:hypothetical protein AB0G92_32680, partial [Streptomyces californicus]